MTEAYLLGGVRTPFARYGGSLSQLRLDDLLGLALAGACERVGVDRDQIEDIIAGCVNPAHEGMGDLARWAALAAGFPDRAAGATINRFCGSSLSATAMIAHAIKRRRPRRRDRLRRRVDVALGVRVHEGRGPVQPARTPTAARHHVVRRRRPTQPRLAGAQRLHRHDRNRAERRRSLPTQSRRDRRVRAALPTARPRRPRLGADSPKRSCPSRSPRPERPRTAP